MSVRSLIVSACVFASVAAPTGALGADLAFAQNYLTGSKQIVSFPVGEPANMTVVGPQADTLVGMDFDPGANVLWAIDFTTQTVGTVNQATGAYASTAMLQGGCCITAFTIDPVIGTFYVSKSDRYVYGLDPASGETTLLGFGAGAGAAITALAADCTGRLFAFDSSVDGGVLYEAHLGVGDPTLIGASGYFGPTSLEFDNESGILYGWFNPPATTSSTHGSIDATTAQVSQTSVFEGKYRMAIRSKCSIFVDGFEA